MKYYLKIILLLITLITYGCVNLTPKKTKEENQQEFDTYVIKNVNVIPMTENNNEVIKSATVVIQNQKIISINDTLPKDSKVIDGTGKWLIPGLIDMHVHSITDINFKENKPTEGANYFLNTQDVMVPFIANGVTTIFDLDSRIEHFAQRNEIIEGKVIGPRMALAPLIDGGDGGKNVNTPEQGRQAVRIAKANGYNFIKVYSFLNVETFKAIVDEAEKQGLKVVGHIPDVFKGNLEEVFVPNFGLVAHAEEYSKHSKDFTVEDAEYFAQLAKKNNTWLTSSLTTMIWIGKQLRSVDSVRNSETLKYVYPLISNRWVNSNFYYKQTSPEFITRVDNLIDFQEKLIRAFNEAKVPIVAGTDEGIPGIVPGFSLQDELELLAAYGMTNEQVLASATRLPAQWLGIDHKVGTIEVGKYADLLLLDENPLENIKNTRKIRGVFVNGTWLDKKKIETMLSDLAKWNTSMKDNDRYQWENRRNY